MIEPLLYWTLSFSSNPVPKVKGIKIKGSLGLHIPEHECNDKDETWEDDIEDVIQGTSCERYYVCYDISSVIHVSPCERLPYR